MNAHDTDSARTTALLEAATDDLGGDVDRLLAGGLARGRSLQRRRRVAGSLAAAAAIGVIGAAAGVALSGADGVTRGIDPADPAPTASLPARTPPRHIGFDVAKGAAILESLLPEGEVRDRWAAGSDKPTGLYRDGRLLFRGALVEVHVERPDVTDSPMDSCRAQPTSTCTALEDGSVIGRVRFEPEDHPGAVSLTSTLYAPDQFVVRVTAYNTSADSPEPVSEEPMLTPAQLDAIATDPVWFDEQQ